MLVSAAEHAMQLEEIYARMNLLPHSMASDKISIPLAEQLDLRMLGCRPAHELLDQPGVNWDDAI
jgi:hypothetical protein